MPLLNSWTALAVLLTAPPAFADLIHRYSFTANANDSVGTSHGVAVQRSDANGPIGVPVEFIGGQAVLDGQGGYIDLPNGLVSTTSFRAASIRVTSFDPTLNTATVCPGADGFAEADTGAAWADTELAAALGPGGPLAAGAADACADAELAAALGPGEPLAAGGGTCPQAAKPSGPALISHRKRRRVMR